MTPEQLLDDLTFRGVALDRRGDKLHVVAPVGVLTDADRSALAEHRDALFALVGPPPLELERMQRASWVGAARELGETAGWPSLTYRPGHAVAPGALAWSTFLGRASIPQLRAVLAALREYLAALGAPSSAEQGSGQR